MQDRLALHFVFSFFPFLPKPLDLFSGLAFRILFCHVSSLCASNFQFLFQTHLIWQRIQTLISKHRCISQMVELSEGLTLVLSFCLASKSRVADDCSLRGACLLCHVQNICHHLALVRDQVAHFLACGPIQEIYRHEIPPIIIQPFFPKATQSS